MATSKYNIQRIKHLLSMLKENRFPNYPRFLAEMKKLDWAGAYKLSARTLLRDIDFSERISWRYPMTIPERLLLMFRIGV